MWLETCRSDFLGFLLLLATWFPSYRIFLAFVMYTILCNREMIHISELYRNHPCKSKSMLIKLALVTIKHYTLPALHPLIALSVHSPLSMHSTLCHCTLTAQSLHIPSLSCHYCCHSVCVTSYGVLDGGRWRYLLDCQQPKVTATWEELPKQELSRHSHSHKYSNSWRARGGSLWPNSWVTRTHLHRCCG